MNATQVQADPPRGESAIVEVEERPDERAHRRRYMPMAKELGPQDDYLIEPLEPVSRAAIEDRWVGLMERRYDPSKLQKRLDDVLGALIAGLTRRDLGEDVLAEGQIQDMHSWMGTDELQATIREWLIERASRPGVAR